MTRNPLLALVILALGAASSSAAEVTVGADAGFFSAYVWRGVSLTNRFVIQPDVWVTVSPGAVSLTGGVWSNIEPRRYDGPNEISESGAESSFDVAEVDWWLDAAFEAGPATITAGATGYLFPNDAGLTDELNTMELYMKAAFDVLLSPKFNVYYDVDEVKGIYAEGGIGYTAEVSESFSVTFGALVGYNDGQSAEDAGEDEAANFFEDGVTHWDISAAAAWSVGSVTITPQIHYVSCVDEFTKTVQPDETSGHKVWGGIAIAWSNSWGGEDEE